MLKGLSIAACLSLGFADCSFAQDAGNRPPGTEGAQDHVRNPDLLTAVIVGSGSPEYNPDRAGPSVLISFGDTRILVDAGNGAQANLDALGIPIRDLDGLLFTHHHLDHNEEFVPIFIRSMLGGNAFGVVGPAPMTAMAETTMEQYEADIAYRLARTGRIISDIEENFWVEDISGGERFMLGGIEISTTSVNHTIKTTAYRFDAGNQSIVVSGDLTYSESLPALAKSSDLIIMDSGAVKKVGQDGQRRRDGRQGNSRAKGERRAQAGGARAHASLADVARMASEAGTGQLVLTDFTSGTVDEKATVDEIRKSYGGPIIFATDLMVVTAAGRRADHLPPAPRATVLAASDGLANPCTVTPAFDNAVIISEDDDQRHIQANAIPAHDIGTFPNEGNPNSLLEQSKSYTIPLAPEIQEQLTYVYDQGIDRGRPNYVWGVALNGIKIEPSANEFFHGPDGPNYGWTVEALSSDVFLGEDCNNAHIQPNGEYHYHGSPTGLVDELTSGAAPSSMTLTGWAADGFPIYYAWGPSNPYDLSSELIELQPSYELRSGERPGDGLTAPDGPYSGRYVRDYVYREEVGDLDACNGRAGATPEFPNGTYYYVLTESFPFAGRCLVGAPSEDFKIGGGRPTGVQTTGAASSVPADGRPHPEEIMNRMDRNADGIIERSEARGPLRANFDRHDRNGDGAVRLDELGRPSP